MDELQLESISQEAYIDQLEDYLDAALNLIVGSEEMLSSTDMPLSRRVQSVREPMNIYIRYMAEQGYIELEREQ